MLNIKREIRLRVKKKLSWKTNQLFLRKHCSCFLLLCVCCWFCWAENLGKYSSLALQLKTLAIHSVSWTTLFIAFYSRQQHRTFKPWFDGPHCGPVRFKHAKSLGCINKLSGTKEKLKLLSLYQELGFQQLQIQHRADFRIKRLALFFIECI